MVVLILRITTIAVNICIKSLSLRSRNRFWFPTASLLSLCDEFVLIWKFQVAIHVEVQEPFAMIVPGIGERDTYFGRSSSVHPSSLSSVLFLKFGQADSFKAIALLDALTSNSSRTWNF